MKSFIAAISKSLNYRKKHIYSVIQPRKISDGNDTVTRLLFLLPLLLILLHSLSTHNFIVKQSIYHRCKKKQLFSHIRDLHLSKTVEISRIENIINNKKYHTE